MDNTLGCPRENLFGITRDFVEKLGNGSISPEEAKRFLRQENPWPERELAPGRRVLTVDMDADPYLPSYFTLRSHETGMGRVRLWHKNGWPCLNGEPIKLWSQDEYCKRNSCSYDSEKFLLGADQEIRFLRLLNANLLDALIQPENQVFIPKAWRKRNIFFLGTQYHMETLHEDSITLRRLTYGGGCNGSGGKGKCGWQYETIFQDNWTNSYRYIQLHGDIAHV